MNFLGAFVFVVCASSVFGDLNLKEMCLSKTSKDYSLIGSMTGASFVSASQPTKCSLFCQFESSTSMNSGQNLNVQINITSTFTATYPMANMAECGTNMVCGGGNCLPVDVNANNECQINVANTSIAILDTNDLCSIHCIMPPWSDYDYYSSTYINWNNISVPARAPCGKSGSGDMCSNGNCLPSSTFPALPACCSS